MLELGVGVFRLAAAAARLPAVAVQGGPVQAQQAAQGACKGSNQRQDPSAGCLRVCMQWCMPSWGQQAAA